MKIYTSNRLNFYTSGFVILFLIVVWLYFQSFYLVLLLLPFTFFPLFLIIVLSIFDVDYYIQSGCLYRRYKGNLSVFEIELSEINKIEKRKNVLKEPYILIVYGKNKSINIYLESYEIEELIKDISEKRDPSV